MTVNELNKNDTEFLNSVDETIAKGWKEIGKSRPNPERDRWDYAYVAAKTLAICYFCCVLPLLFFDIETWPKDSAAPIEHTDLKANNLTCNSCVASTSSDKEPSWFALPVEKERFRIKIAPHSYYNSCFDNVGCTSIFNNSDRVLSIDVDGLEWMGN